MTMKSTASSIARSTSALKASRVAVRKLATGAFW